MVFETCLNGVGRGGIKSFHQKENIIADFSNSTQYFVRPSISLTHRVHCYLSFCILRYICTSYCKRSLHHQNKLTVLLYSHSLHIEHISSVLTMKTDISNSKGERSAIIYCDCLTNYGSICLFVAFQCTKRKTTFFWSGFLFISKDNWHKVVRDLSVHFQSNPFDGLGFMHAWFVDIHIPIR